MKKIDAIALSEKLHFLTKLSEYSEGQEVEILSTAKQTDVRYGDFSFSKNELEEMAKNFNEDVVGTEIAVDENHDPNHRALAWLAPGSMRVGPSVKLSGQHSLFVKLERPTPDGRSYLAHGTYRYFSVEVQRQFDRVKDGVKKIFSNVIRGLALTNRPVIKDLAPTFNEQNISINHTNAMTIEAFKLFSGSLLSKVNLSEADVTTLKTLSEELPDADKPAAQEDIDEAEKKVKEAKEAEEAKQADDTAEAEAKKALAEAAGKTSFSLSEVQALVKEAIREPMRVLNESLDASRTNLLSSQVDALMLSENNSVGFKPDAKSKVLDFVKKLSDPLAKEYFELHSGITASVDFNEYGSGSGNSEFSESKPENATQKLVKLAESISKEENIDLSEAMLKAYEQNPDLGKAAEKVSGK